VIAEIVAYADAHAQAAITTNGFLLSDKLVERLNNVVHFPHCCPLFAASLFPCIASRQVYGL